MALEERFIIRRIQSEVDKGINSDEGDVTNVRQNMFSRYMGEQYGNERDGYSKYVSRQVLEAIEWALPSLLRVFTGPVKAVEFRPSGPGDEEQARHETDVVNYWFHEGSDDTDTGSGFMVLYSILKDILMFPNGYLKIVLREYEDTETASYEAVSRAQMDALEDADEEVEVEIEAERGVDEMGVPRFDVNVTRKVWQKRVVVEPVPPDCLIVAHGHNKLDVDSSPFVCIRQRKTRSDLIQEGYDAAALEELAPDDSDTWNDEEVTRHFYTDEEPDRGGDDTYDLPADEEFWVHECYMRIDHDEDGVNELRKIVMAGCKILENEPIDYNPVVAASAIPIPHKHIGMSYAEIVADLQELMTVLTRQLLDNIYKMNVQRKYISESALLSDNTTMDQLLDGTAEVVVVRGAPGVAVMPEVNTPIVAEIAGVMEGLRDAPQLRTGVAPQLSLDPSVLEKSTMGAFMGALEQASQRLELLARLFAETALKKAFQKIHYVLRTYFDTPQDVLIKDKWVQTDPSKWRKRANMTVNVGLGFNNKQVQLGLLSQLLTIQKEALGSGLADAVKIYATLEKLIEQANVGHAATFFNDPREPGFKAPEPQKDAAMILAEAQAEALRAEIKRKDLELTLRQRETSMKAAADTEAAEAKAAELNQKLLELKFQYAKLQNDIAVGSAKISEANAKAGGENTSADEYDQANQIIRSAPGATVGERAKTTKERPAA